jgi:hypothetical protein
VTGSSEETDETLGCIKREELLLKKGFCSRS